MVVLTGAGMSAESGLKTFREMGGLWETHNVYDVASPDGWARDPGMVLRFYNERRKQLLETSPNQGHLDLVELEKYFDVRIVTQNVDDLHERAGEAVPAIEEAAEIVSTAGILVVIGSSLNVYPAAGLINYVPEGVPVFVIDPNEVSIPGNSQVSVISEPAGTGVRKLFEALKNE